MDFKDLGLNSSLLATLDKLGYSQPTPIQAQAIPPVLEGKDVMAAAQTGTGKTAGFTLPILHRLITQERPSNKKSRGNQVRVLVLTPTRELAAQVAQSVEDYGRGTGVKSVVVFGGVSINPQMQKLRGGVDVLIATPGRLLDLHGQGAVKFDQLEVFVLDEADRMLDMGFIVDIKRVLKLVPKQRQNLLFSATFSQDIRNLAKSIVQNPVEVSVTPPNSTVDAIEQSLIAVEKSDKTRILAQLIQENDWYQVLVFARTRHGANRLAGKLEKQGINSMAIHGDKSQSARTKALASFKSGRLRVLVATDIAARGIDIEQLPQVINFDLPQVAEDYVHRIGRTGRAGATGHALSLVSHDEYKQLTDIERFIKKEIPRIELEGYEPANNLKASKGDFSDTKSKPAKPKKAKLPRGGKANKEKIARAEKQRSKPRSDSAGSRKSQRGQRSQQSASPWGKSGSEKSSSTSRRGRQAGAKQVDDKSEKIRQELKKTGVKMEPAKGSDGPNRKQRRAALRAEYERLNASKKAGSASSNKRPTGKSAKPSSTKR